VTVAVYRQKPGVVEAERLTAENFDAVGAWAGVEECWELTAPTPALLIHKHGGVMKAFLGDWVIKDAQGAISVCDPVTFGAAYESAGHENWCNFALYGEHNACNCKERHCPQCGLLVRPDDDRCGSAGLPRVAEENRQLRDYIAELKARRDRSH
jgi:hypothetical protein